jgi:hypothetical protein
MGGVAQTRPEQRGAPSAPSRSGRARPVHLPACPTRPRPGRARLIRAPAPSVGAKKKKNPDENEFPPGFQKGQT